MTEKMKGPLFWVMALLGVLLMSGVEGDQKALEAERKALEADRKIYEAEKKARFDECSEDCDALDLTDSDKAAICIKHDDGSGRSNTITECLWTCHIQKPSNT